MISLLTSFKDFLGDAGRLQDNSLRNWRHLGSDIEIIIYGNGVGVAEKARQYCALHIPSIECSPAGIPRFDKLVDHATRHAKHDRQLYLNGDILLPPNLSQQINRMPSKRFLMVGQRIDVSENSSFNPVAPNWVGKIRQLEKLNQLRLAPPSYTDYFIFPRGLWTGLAPVTIGRGGYDNALIAYCLRHRIPIYNATRVLHVVHQWHGYGHIKGAFNAAYFGVDATANRCIHDIEHSPPDLADADWEMFQNKILIKKLTLNIALRKFEVTARYRFGWKYPSYILRAMDLALKRVLVRPDHVSLSSILTSNESSG